ncbi:hypothetical protein KOW79_006988 [Hemibagrus wyckioides]|uniref:Uncharacterized protein n=1 Tax=Hemibagrus wyckioides TaxID=337641 RepID=A0A9D3NV52_9TELE|nr:hypothetical protein KOW79_006988 [Hemibagrus wyckioides]
MKGELRCTHEKGRSGMKKIHLALRIKGTERVEIGISFKTETSQADEHQLATTRKSPEAAAHTAEPKKTRMKPSEK